MAKVIILCGKIASGKTYYAESLKKQTNAIILSVDDIMLKLSDSCLGERHDDIALRCQNYFYGLAEQILAAGHDVIIDYGYWLKAERINAKEYFRKRNIPAELHYINKPWEIRIRQLARRNETLIKNQSDDTRRVYLIDEELCRRLDHKFEEPSAQEYDKLIS